LDIVLRNNGLNLEIDGNVLANRDAGYLKTLKPISGATFSRPSGCRLKRNCDAGPQLCQGGLDGGHAEKIF